MDRSTTPPSFDAMSGRKYQDEVEDLDKLLLKSKALSKSDDVEFVLAIMRSAVAAGLHSLSSGRWNQLFHY